MSSSQSSPGQPNLFTIRAERPFLDALAEAILEDQLGLGVDGGDPTALARMTIFLPTRRAARLLGGTLMRRAGRDALLLPRIVPLGDPGEVEMSDLMSEPALIDGAPNLSPIDPVARRILLAYQIRAASRARRRQAALAGAEASLAADDLGAAYKLAGDLGGILDALQAEGIPFEALAKLDATRFDQHWQFTGKLLAILGETWPILLAARGEIDLVDWRNLLLERERERLCGPDMTDPVIVAGSTGSMPATRALIAAIARRPRGAVVLRDLDAGADAGIWAALKGLGAGDPARDRVASHPQAQLAILLGEIGAEPSTVTVLGEGPPAQAARRKLANEALRPGETTHVWRTLGDRLTELELSIALDGVAVAEASDEREEALVCAIAIRRALAEGDGSVALTTPDRGLAERVRLELGRWGIEVDDGAGQALARTQAGRLAMLLAEFAARGITPRTLLSFLGHPAVRLGLAPAELRRLRQGIEIGALRGARLGPGLEGLAAAVRAMPARIADKRAPRPRKRIEAQACEDALALVQRLSEVLAPWFDLPLDADLAGRAEGLRAALAALTRDDLEQEHAFEREDGEELDRLLDDFATQGQGVTVLPHDFLRILKAELADRVVRPRVAGHPRVSIYGLLEARLMSPDLAIVAGLNEGTWPPRTMTDAFLNRGMRLELGLSSPERRIGQSAHDFVEALGAPRVLLTRSIKSGGEQAIPSRFWQRLRTVAKPESWGMAVMAGSELLAWARRLDRPEQLIRIGRPAPKPPRELQPASFSVTEVEALYRDPYAVYARRVLGLKKLEPLDVELGAADRGLLLHEVMERFARSWPAALPDQPEAELRRIGEAVFAEYRDEPDVEAFWWPRFVQMIPAIADWERARRDGVRRIGVEMTVEDEIALPDGSIVKLHARADRVELLADGRLAIVDFKSGAIPSAKQIEAGFAPQLLLEAALARRKPYQPEGPGDAMGPGPAGSAKYVALKPGEKAMAVTDAAGKADLEELAATHLDGFRKIVAEFRSGDRAFVSRFAPEFIRREGDYDHLARVKEWTVLGDDGEGGEE